MRHPPAGQILAIAAVLWAASPAHAADGPTGPTGPYGERLRIDERGITLTFPDDSAKLRIGGRLQLDFGAAGLEQQGLPEPFSDNLAVRRSWIESYLTIGKTLELAFQYDFADATRPIDDAAIGWKGIPDTILTVGNMKEPFSLDQLISDNNTVFTERSLADAFAPGRNFGFAIGRAIGNWTAVVGVFGGNANTGIRSEGVSAAGRLTVAPINTDAEVLHFGIAGNYRSLPRDEGPLRLSSRSEAFLFARPYVNTGEIQDASSVGRIGLEAAYRRGPVLIKAEYIRTEVDRFGGARSLSFQGGYIDASVVLNGEGRHYALTPDYGTTYAIFSGVRVGDADRVSNGGFGVFELATRFSAIDLDDGLVRGGVERDVSVGLNWYPDRNVRLMADYVRSHAAPSSVAGGRTVDADTVIGRLQFYW